MKELSNKREVFEDFLQESKALHDFRQAYLKQYQFESLDLDDQDVRRLMEAMAYYSARTRASAERAIVRYERQALEQLFPHLLTPLPAMALAWPSLGANMKDVRGLCQHARFSAESKGTTREKPAAVTFRTVDKSDVFPFAVVPDSVELEQVPSSFGGAGELGWTLRMTLRGSSRIFEDKLRPLKFVSFQVAPWGDEQSALRIFDAFERALEGVQYRFRSGDREQRFTQGTCAFGQDNRSGSLHNPIEVIRQQLHFPLGALKFQVPVALVPAQWDELELVFQLGASWPETIGVSADTFVLNAVTVENLERSGAEPVPFDARRTAVPIRHPEPASGMKFRELFGVYMEDTALMPGGCCDDGYTVDVEGKGSDREAWLDLEGHCDPEGKPGVVRMDAEWFQPAAARLPAGSATLKLDSQDVGDVHWQLLVPMSPPADSPLMGNRSAMNQLLRAKNQANLDLEALLLLLRVVGVDESRMFCRLPRYIQSLTTCWSPDLQASARVIRLYELEVSLLPPVLAPALRFLFGMFPQLLATWTGESDVRVQAKVTLGQSVENWSYEWRAENDAI